MAILEVRIRLKNCFGVYLYSATNFIFYLSLNKFCSAKRRDTYDSLMNPSFNNLAVTSCRSELRNISLVVIDKLLFGFPPLYPLREVNQAM